MSGKQIGILVGVGVFLLLLLTFSGKIFQTNQTGHFQVKQAAISGDVTVRTRPGVYFQNFGTIYDYKNVATVGFGRVKGEGSADIEPIRVIFNDGSLADVSGLVRVTLPMDIDKIKQLKIEYSDGFEHFIRSGIVPIVENAVKLSANLRSAQDAYTTLALFQQAVEDQLVNGVYLTKSDVKTITRATGDTEQIKVTEIVYDEETGKAKRISNRFAEIGCSVNQCVVDLPDFDDKVKSMIAQRKDEAMKTELAKQEAIRAKQDTITEKEKGIARVAKAKADKEVEKIKEITDALKEKEVGILKAQKQFEMAKLDKLKAKEEAEARLIQERAKAESNRLLVNAGLTPQQKAEWKFKTDVGVAAELAKIKFPGMMVIGGNSGNGSTLNPFDAVGLKTFIEINESMSNK